MKILSLLFVLMLGSSACLQNSQNQVNDRGNLNASPANVEVSVLGADAGGESQTARAEAIVADLYKQHDAKKSPFFQTKDRVLVDRYFTKQLADLIWKDAVTSEGEIGGLDADPLYNAQDIEIKNLKVGAAEVNGDKATVPVTFSNYSEKITLRFSLSLVNDAWKIADINYGGKDTLLTWLRPAPPETAIDVELGDFRGKYFVGETSCTVEYKNKGYAVKWAKGRGLEYFAMMDGNTFTSSTDESEANKFVFDDDELSTGTFYRADGKTFVVRRAK